MRTIADIAAQANAIRKGVDGRNVVEGHDFRHGYFSAQPNTRYEACRFYDAQMRVDGVGGVQFADCDFRASSVYLRNASNIDLIDNNWQGQFEHDFRDDKLPNDRIGPSGCIRTDGGIGSVNVFNNRFVGVLRAWHSQVTDNIADITFAFNLFSGLVRSHADTNRGECVLFHKAGNDEAKVERFASYHDTFDRWSPVDHAGDMLPPELDQNVWNFNAGKKAAVDFHFVNANDIYMYRPTLGKHDVLRFFAPDGGKIRRINVQEAITDGAAISRYGDVKDIVRTKIGAAGGEIPIID